MGAIAWYSSNSGGRTHRVGQRQPNAFGLHDMLGNVWEWTQDWHGQFPGGNLTDPVGPSSGSRKVGKGGPWRLGAQYNRAASRCGYCGPEVRVNDVGFRLARTADAGGAWQSSSPAADDHGDDRTNPTQFKLGESQAGRIETADDVDVFIFGLGQRTEVAIYTTGTLDTEGRVLDFSGNEVASNLNSGAGSNFRIGQDLGWWRLLHRGLGRIAVLPEPMNFTAKR